MVVVKVEMWPFGDESKKYEIGQARIVNDGKGDRNTGHYSFLLRGGVAGRSDLLDKVWKSGRVEGFARIKRGVWDLLYLCLKQAVASRNGD
jgi:hypothetical protein